MSGIEDQRLTGAEMTSPEVDLPQDQLDLVKPILREAGVSEPHAPVLCGSRGSDRARRDSNRDVARAGWFLPPRQGCV